MKKTLIILAISAMYSSTTTAQDLVLNPIVVTATRVAQPINSVVGDITLVTSEEVAKSGAMNLPELLRTVPGVQISQTGGAGQSSAVFLRGSNSDEVLVLIDGMRINSATLGTASLENIPLSQVDHIEILRGPSANIYGSDAIGGVIQIFTHRSDGQQLITAKVGYGSYNTKQAEASVSGGLDDFKYSLTVAGSDTQSFSAYTEPTNSHNADDDGYSNQSFTASAEYTFMKGHSIGASGFYSEGKADYDTDEPYDNNQKSQQNIYQVFLKDAFTDYWTSTITLGQSQDKANDYSQPSPWTGDGKSYFETTQKQFSWLHSFDTSYGRIVAIYEHLEQDVESTTDYTKDSRSNNAFAGTYTIDVGSNTFLVSARNDDNSQYGSHSTGGVGYAFRFTDALRATASYGTAFKAPTFNQLYWPGFGNPNLKPEESDNYEASLRYETDKTELSIVGFVNKVSNLVEFTGPPSGFDPVNVGKAKMQGATITAGLALTDNITLRGNTTFQSAKNEETDNDLVRRSNRYGSLGIDTTYGKLQATVETTYASKRYNDADNNIPLTGYALVNTIVTYQVSEEWKLQARVNNLLDKGYVLASTKGPWSPDGSDYGTEGTNAFVSATYTFK